MESEFWNALSAMGDQWPVAEGPVELMHNDRKGVYPGLSRWRNQGLERKLTVRDSALGSYTAPFFGGRLRWAALSYVGRVQSG